MGRNYEKHPKHFCKGCHKSFRTKRALKAHNDTLHASKSIPEEYRLADSGDLRSTGRGRNSVRDDPAPDLIIIDESTPFDPKWFDKL